MVLRLLMKSVTGKQGASILCTAPDLQAPRTLIFPRSALCRQGQGQRNKTMSPGRSTPATPLSVAQQPILHPRFSNPDLRWGPKCQSSFPLPSPVTVWAVILSSSLYGHPWAAGVLAGRWRWIHVRIWMEAGRASLSPPAQSSVTEDCSEVFWLQVVPPLLEIKSILALFNRNLLLLFIIPE